MAHFYSIILSNPILWVPYLLLTILVSWRGAGTILGFWGNVLLSLIITPIILLVLIALFSDRRPIEKRG